MSRNSIFDALLALGAAILPLGPGSAWGAASRRLGDPHKGPKPALYQVEFAEKIESRLGQMPKRQLSVMWIIYHDAGKDQAAIPAATSANLIDAIEAKLSAPVHRQSLSGQVYAAFIDGEIRKWEGDDDGLSIITVPITILLP